MEPKIRGICSAESQPAGARAQVVAAIPASAHQPPLSMPMNALQ